MSILNSQIKRYPLLPYSQLVWEMTRWMPSVYRFPFVLRWKDGAKEIDRIDDAIRTALANHPVFSMQVDWKGMHYTTERSGIFSGKYHKILLSEEGDDIIIHAELSRILGDGISMEILLKDVLRAYQGEALEPDDYWGYMARYEQRKSEPHYLQSKKRLEQEFADSSVPVRPTIDRKCITTLLPPKAGLYEDDCTLLYEKIGRLKAEEYISYEGIFSLCAALAITDYCGTDAAALTWAYEGRERPEEQRIFGSLHRDIPFQINHKSKIINQKSDLIRLARNQIRSGIAHSDYPYTLTSPYSKRWNYAVNVLRAPDENTIREQLPEFLELQPFKPQKYAYALLDMEIVEHGDSLQLRYRYSATHYKPESIRRFAALVRKYVKWLID